MSHIKQIKKELEHYVIPEKAAFFPRFFQAYPGGYGDGDFFLGIKVPDQRKVAKKYYKEMPLLEVEGLLQDSIHECRLTALFILVKKFEKAKTEAGKKEIVDIYLKNLSFVNNWDLVDSSAYHILGAYLFDKDEEKGILYELAAKENLWQQRVAIIATFYFIKQGRFQETLEIAEKLLFHQHDLIHKAVGWMLREVGNRDLQVELTFLNQHYNNMPRTMLRYAIEKFDEELRLKYLRGLM